MATRREIYAAEAEHKQTGIELRLKSTDSFLPQYSNDVKIERTAGGLRATVHAYGDNEQEVRERAIRLIFDTEDDIANRKVVRSVESNDLSNEAIRISEELNKELAKEK